MRIISVCTDASRNSESEGSCSTDQDYLTSSKSNADVCCRALGKWCVCVCVFYQKSYLEPPKVLVKYAGIKMSTVLPKPFGFAVFWLVYQQFLQQMILDLNQDVLHILSRLCGMIGISLHLYIIACRNISTCL